MTPPVPLSAGARIWQSQGVSGVKRLARCRFFLLEMRAGARFFSLTEASRCGGMKSFPVSLSGGAPIWQGEGLEFQAPEVFQSYFFLARV